MEEYKREVKFVYIAHPIKDDVESNMEKVVEICEEIRDENPDIVPVAPYLATLQYLDDESTEDRLYGAILNEKILGLCDALWAFGDSEGVRAEIELAIGMNIEVLIFEDTEGDDNE